MGNFSVEQLQELAMVLLVAIGGSGTVVLIGRMAVNKAIKTLINLVTRQKDENKISQKTSDLVIASLKAENKVLNNLLTSTNNEIKDLRKEYTTTNEHIIRLIGAVDKRDKELTEFLESEVANE